MLKVYIDGASRGNPGNASYAFVIKRGNKTLFEESNFIGIATNNVAEYTALVKAEEFIIQNFKEEKEVIIYSDSELLTKQLMGIYRVRDSKIKVLADKARELSKNFTKFSVVHIRREKNERSDRLCRDCLNKI